MSVIKADGSPLNAAGLNALTADPPGTRFLRVVTVDVYQQFAYPGDHSGERGTRLLYRAGQIVTQTQLDALFNPATVLTIDPPSGRKQGGLNVTITGTDLGGVTAVTFDAKPATLVRVVDETMLTCRTPGTTTTGPVTVTVVDDSGTVTKAAFYTYT